MKAKGSRRRSNAAKRGWETRRRNAASDKPAAPPKPAADARKPLRIRPELLARAGKSREVPRANPFTLPQFPPKAFPPKESRQRMAMDDACGWASGGWQAAAIAGIYAEGLAFPGYAFLAELAQRPEYRRFAEILATEMTRKWIRFQSVSGDDDKADRIKELTDAVDAFKLRDAIRRCIELDELFGRSHLYIDTGATDHREELKTSIGSGRDEVSRAKVTKDSLVAFRPVEPVWVYPINYDADDPLKPDWYEPVTWFVMGKEVHKTRLLKFTGREVPDLLKPAYSFGGLSMTQMSKPYVDNWLRTRQSVADLIHAFSVFVLKTNLSDSLMADGDQLFTRADFFNRMRDNRGLMLVDKETEDFANVSTTIGGLEGLQAQTQEHLAAVSGIPIVKLLGIQPTGLNATDEGGIRMFYDWIAACQEKRIQANLTSAIDFIQLSIWGEVDQDIIFAFEPLWSLDEKALAEKREVEARTDVSLIDAGVLSPEEVRERIAADAESPHASIDTEEAPDLRAEEEEGLDPKAGGGQRGIGRAPHAPSNNLNDNDNENAGGEDGEDDEPEDLAPFHERVNARAERHARREGDFYDRARDREDRNRSGNTPFHARARERSERGRDYLQRRIADRQAEEEEPEHDLSADAWEEHKHPRGKGGKFAKGGGGAAGAKPETKAKSDKPKKAPGKGTEAERTEIRKKLRAEKDITGEGAKKLRQELIASYYVSLEKARKAGNKDRIAKFQERLLSFGEPRSKVTGEARQAKHSPPQSPDAAERVKQARKQMQVDASLVGKAEVERKADTLARVAVDLGVKDFSKLRISAEDKQFSLNGQKLNYAGGFDPTTSNITMYDPHATEDFIESGAAHEIMHAKFDHAKNKFQAQELEASRNGDLRVGGNGFELKPSGKGKYPVWEKWTEAFVDVDPEIFAATDGVSAYSTDWWIAYQNGRASLEQAVNETLAEMSALQYAQTYWSEATGGWTRRDRNNPHLPRGHEQERYRGAGKPEPPAETVQKSHDVWLKLYQVVEELYAA